MLYLSHDGNYNLDPRTIISYHTILFFYPWRILFVTTVCSTRIAILRGGVCLHWFTDQHYNQIKVSLILASLMRRPRLRRWLFEIVRYDEIIVKNNVRGITIISNDKSIILNNIRDYLLIVWWLCIYDAMLIWTKIIYPRPRIIVRG